jgi:type III secretion system low calcium response chaperone LcrH/SycD
MISEILLEPRPIDHKMIGELLLKTRSIDPKTMTFEEAESIYEFASDLYEAGHYQKASPLFQTVATFCPLEYKNWFGLASSLQMEARYEEALTAWTMTACLCEKDASPYLHVAECYLSLKKREEALNALYLALPISCSEMTKKIEGMISLIEVANV